MTVDAASRTTIAAARAIAGAPKELLVDGAWRPAAGEATFAVEDPATGRVIARVADATAEDALAALRASSVAFERFRWTHPRGRADVLWRAHALMTQCAEEFALLVTVEMCKPLGEARAEIAYAASFLRWYAEEASAATVATAISTAAAGDCGSAASRWARV